MKRFIFLISILVAAAVGAGAQTKLANGVEVDKTIHNFGDILLNSGPVACTFTFSNKGSKPVVMYNVTTTCGCTDATWTKEPIKPGAKGEITIKYSNDEGPYPFDKTITVYMSDLKKPVILKLRGASIEKAKPLKELYPVSYGPLGLKESSIKCGNLEQGTSKTNAVMLANLSGSPLNLTFKDVSPQLTLKLSQNPIPAGGTAELTFTVTADRKIWGKHTYHATPVCNGKTYKNADGEPGIGIWAFTKENFSNLTDEQRQKGPMPRFEASTFNFGKAKAGDIIHATFTFRNEGKSDFRSFKTDSDAGSFTCSEIPVTAPGKTATFTVDLNTKDMPKGESLTIITLTTNSPTRPIVNLFISGTLY